MKLILVEEMENGMTLAQDLFLSIYDPVPIVSSGIVINEYIIDKIKATPIRSVYVESPPGREVKGHPMLEAELRDEALDVLEKIFENVGDESAALPTEQMIQRVGPVVEKMVDAALKECSTLVNINDLKSYDDYTYHHSLSVAVLSLAIGLCLGYRRQRLVQLGMCAMVHDIGKTVIPVEVIRKPSRLNPEEWLLVRTHPVAGYKYLAENNIGTEEMRLGVASHHEKVDGTGYPQGLENKKIPEWGRIISVADVYDALTSNRAYRKPMEPAEAIEYIMGGVGSSFDFDMVQALVKKIDLYPIGLRVELSDGGYAEVIDNQNQMRPIIRREENKEEIDLFRDRKYLSLVIRRVAPKE